MNQRLIGAGFLAALVAGSAHADLLSDLVVYYDFEDLANDPAASGPDATEAGTGSYTGAAGGVAGNAAEFTGTSGDFIDTAIGFGGAGGNELGDNFTVSCWYRLDTDAASEASRFFIYEGRIDYDLSYGIRAFGGAEGFNDTQVYTHGPVPGTDYNVAHLDAHVPGSWQHVLMTYVSDGTDTTITTYIDGVPASRIVQETAELSTDGIHIGNAREIALNRAFDGQIDEFAAWGRVLESAEIQEAYARGAAAIHLTVDLATLGKALVSVTASDSGGTVSGTGIYDLDATVPILATVEPGYVFEGWGGDFAGQPASFGHTVTGTAAAQAQFGQDQGDDDGDGLTNYEEIIVHLTDVDNPDSDGDRIPDGAEVNQTGTDPTIEDSFAVDYVLAELCTDGAGPDDTVLSRDAGTGTLSFKLSARASAALAGWTDVAPGEAGVSGAIQGDAVELTLPGTADPARFFRLLGGEATP